MESKGSSLDLFLILGLLTFAVVLIDDRWIRAAVTVVPALLLVQRASVVASWRAGQVGETSSSSERRADGDVRGYVEELLKQIREFYATCHLLAGGKISPEDAKAQAGKVEKSLNLLLAKVTEAGPKG